MTNARVPNIPSLADLIATLQMEAGLGTPRALPPVHLWNPAKCGDIGLEIRRDGSWWQDGVRFTRERLIRLFASILRRETDGYYLVTPHEKVAVRVEDAPFAGIRADRHLTEGHQTILVTTNVGDVVALGEGHPFRVSLDQRTGEPSAYVMIRAGLEARLMRPPYYEIISWLEPDPDDPGAMCLTSGQARFTIGRVS